MFELFDGQVGSKRNINLSGASRSRQTKDNLIRKAMVERQQRENERKRVLAAERIQDVYRKYVKWKRMCGSYQYVLDTFLTESKNPVTTTKATTTTSSSSKLDEDIGDINRLRNPVSILSLFLVCCPRTDRIRMRDMICYLIQPDSTSGNVRLVDGFNGDAVRWKWIIVRMTTRILESMHRECCKLVRGHANSDGFMDLCIQLFAKLFDETWSRNHTHLDAIESTRICVIDGGIFNTVVDMINMSVHDTKIVHRLPVTYATKITVLVLCSFRYNVELRTHMIHVFVTTVMCVNGLVGMIRHAIPGAVDRVIPIHIVTQVVVKCIDDGTLHRGSDGDQTISVADNVMEVWIGRKIVGAVRSGDDGDFMQCMKRILGAVDPRTMMRVLSAHDADEDTKPSTASTSMHHHTTIERFAMRLTSDEFVNDVSNVISAVSSKCVPSAIEVLAMMLVLVPSKRIDVIAIVLGALKTKMLNDMWMRVKQSVLWTDLVNGHDDAIVNALSGSGGNVDLEWCQMIVFGEMMCHVLRGIGDDELFNPNLFISVSDLVVLGSISTRLALRLIQHKPTQDAMSTSDMGTHSTAYVKTVMVNMARLLHSRDSRKRFCPIGHWMVDPSMLEPDFIDQIVSMNTASILSPAMLSRHTIIRDILRDVPFVVPFETRVQVLRLYILRDRDEWESRYGRDYRPIVNATIHRGTVFEDGYSQLNPLGSSLKGRISITFIDKNGMTEAGIDGGGVFKEFLTSCLMQALDTNYGLFQATRDQLLYPSSSDYATQDTQLQLMEFLGRILGKAVYDGVLVDVSMANFFLAKWLGKRSYLDDLPSLDPDLYHGLMILKNYDGDVEQDMSLTFSVTENEFGVTKTVELIPNGLQTPVTSANRIRYIYLMANYKLNVKISKQCQAFFRGLSDLIDPTWLKMFNEQELQIMLSGTSNPVDIGDMQRHVTYSGVYDENHETIKLFWSVVSEFDEEMMKRLVKFVTSCSRPPLLGFRELLPPMCIRDSGNDQERLPTASTCMNLLKLPIYKSRDQLKRKLMYAIMSESGFELS